MSMIDLLEGRRLFSVSPVFDPADLALVVNVDGYVEVRETSDGTFQIFDQPNSAVPINADPFADISNLRIVGSSGNDTIHVTVRREELSVLVQAGSGEDTIYVSDLFGPQFDPDANPPVIVDGQVLLDPRGRQQRFEVHGGNGRDHFEVLRGSNTYLFGQNADDVFIVWEGTAHLDGGNGIDSAYLDLGTAVTFGSGKGASYFYGGDLSALGLEQPLG